MSLSKLEADVLLQAQHEFRDRPAARKAFGVHSYSTPAEVAAAEFRYSAAALRNARDSKDWPARPAPDLDAPNSEGDKISRLLKKCGTSA